MPQSPRSPAGSTSKVTNGVGSKTPFLITRRLPPCWQTKTRHHPGQSPSRLGHRRGGARLRQLGNATPLISIEGTDVVTDERRGRSRCSTPRCEACAIVSRRTHHRRRHESLPDQHPRPPNESWLQRLIDRGVHYTWYHTYRPVGPRSRRTGATPGADPAGAALCGRHAREDADRASSTPTTTTKARRSVRWRPASATTSIRGATSSRVRSFSSRARTSTNSAALRHAAHDSAFLGTSASAAAKTTRGCIVLERPDLVNDLVVPGTPRATRRTGPRRRAGGAERDAAPAQSAQSRAGDSRRALGCTVSRRNIGSSGLAHTLDGLERAEGRGKGRRLKAQG